MDLPELPYSCEAPSISKLRRDYRMEEVFIEPETSREHISVVEQIEDMSWDEYGIISDDYEILRGDYPSSRLFMMEGPDKKMEKKEEMPFVHFADEFDKYHRKNKYYVKRGYSWRNPRSNRVVFTSISSLVEGAKIFIREKDDIEVSPKKGGGAWFYVPSRSRDITHTARMDFLPEPTGKDWPSLDGSCGCEEYRYHNNPKRPRQEYYTCPHTVAGYQKAMSELPEEEEIVLPTLFMSPDRELIDFNKNILKTLRVYDVNGHKRTSKLYQGEREILMYRFQCYRGNHLTFNPRWWHELEI